MYYMLFSAKTPIQKNRYIISHLLQSKQWYRYIITAFVYVLPIINMKGVFIASNR